MTDRIPPPSDDPDSVEVASDAFRRVRRTGVIYVTSEAEARGFRANPSEWCNLGQGQPETGELPGAPPRVETVDLKGVDQDYAPVGGLPELREAVAAMYNELFRKGCASQYTVENVAIAGGGRVALTRACAAVAPIHLGHFLPDYTAYAEVLELFRTFSPTPILLDPDHGYGFSFDELRREILGRGLSAILLSNPCNPTGRLIRDGELEGWIDTARTCRCALILDEFYSHFVWQGDEPIVSAARYVQDVDRDPIVLIDGLTKNWRYPGWRVSWIVGPRPVIRAACSAGSFLDGGGSRPMQHAAIDMVTAEHALQESAAIRAAFLPKRDLMIEGLRRIGVRLDVGPEGTFYAWGDLSGLPEEIRVGQEFFQRALDRKVIVVPGAFFDVDPGSRRRAHMSRFRNHVRFSFGPSLDVVERGLKRLADVVREAE